MELGYTMKNSILSIMIVVITLLVGKGFAHEGHIKNDASNLAVSLVFDQQGQLWRAHVLDGFVFVDQSSDRGKTFSKRVKVNQRPQKIAAKGEERPKIAIAPNGDVYLTWTQGLSKPSSGYIWFSRSSDGGEHFDEPMIVHQDRAEITHRFDALNVAPNGVITVAWVDERDLALAEITKDRSTGAAIYYARSFDRGATFEKEQKLADSSCECCRIAMTNKPDGTAVAMWRHVFEGGERDHMIAEVPKAGMVPQLNRATFGRWKINGCPHHGGSLAIGENASGWWGYHLAYFDGKDKKPGLYYSRMDGNAWVTSPAKKFGNHTQQARYPTVLSMGDKVWLAWLETGADNMNKVMGLTSLDGGKTWSDAGILLNAGLQTDGPQLLQFKETAFLVVNTKEGLKVRALQ